MRIVCPNSPAHTTFTENRFQPGAKISGGIPVLKADGSPAEPGTMPEWAQAAMEEHFVPICLTCGAAATVDYS
jgi:hypothetical protein